jgi:hypothetical protein
MALSQRGLLMKNVARVRFDKVRGGTLITYQSVSPRGSYYAVGDVVVLDDGMEKGAKSAARLSELRKRIADTEVAQ